MYPLIKQGLINQIVVNMPLTIFGHYYIKLVGHQFSREIPTFFQFVKDWIVFLLLREISFYYSHRLLHHQMIYKFIHKKHHEWTSPIALATFYCHPFEHFLVNLVPAILGMNSF